MGFFDKLKNGLTKTKDAFFGQVSDVLKSFRRVDEDLLEEVTRQRAEIRDLLLRRGKAFEEEAETVGLEMLPFDSGFFATIPCADAKDVSRILEEEGIFLVPMSRGLRVSIASISEEKCRILPEKILAAIDQVRTALKA